jgi:hypothetical protein
MPPGEGGIGIIKFHAVKFPTTVNIIETARTTPTMRGGLFNRDPACHTGR